MNRDLFFSSYVETYLQRDIRDLAKVGDEMAFLRFVRACAARTAQLLNIAELALSGEGIEVSVIGSPETPGQRVQHSSWPNPFNPQVNIEFVLLKTGQGAVKQKILLVR